MSTQMVLPFPNWRSNLGLTSEQVEKFCQFVDESHGVHKHDDGGYWFYDETQADEYGPFQSSEEAQAALVDYCKHL